MFWLFLLGILFLMVVSPGFRATVLIVLGIVVVGVYFLVQNDNQQSRIRAEQKAADERARVQAPGFDVTLSPSPTPELPSQPSPPPPTPLPQSSPQPTKVAKEVSGSFHLASCKGWGGTTTAIDGVNSRVARMQGRITRADIREYCNRDPGGETTQYGGKLSIPRCVEKYARQTAKLLLFATADCVSGDISYSVDREPSIATHFPIEIEPEPYNSCASSALAAQFKALCPLSFQAMRLDEEGRAQ
jgi:hypothetical protein